MTNWMWSRWCAFKDGYYEDIKISIIIVAVVTLFIWGLVVLSYFHKTTDKQVELERLKLELEIKRVKEALND